MYTPVKFYLKFSRHIDLDVNCDLAGSEKICLYDSTSLCHRGESVSGFACMICVHLVVFRCECF